METIITSIGYRFTRMFSPENTSLEEMKNKLLPYILESMQQDEKTINTFLQTIKNADKVPLMKECFSGLPEWNNKLLKMDNFSDLLIERKSSYQIIRKSKNDPYFKYGMCLIESITITAPYPINSIVLNNWRTIYNDNPKSNKMEVDLNLIDGLSSTGFHVVLENHQEGVINYKVRVINVSLALFGYIMLNMDTIKKIYDVFLENQKILSHQPIYKKPLNSSIIEIMKNNVMNNNVEVYSLHGLNWTHHSFAKLLFMPLDQIKSSLFEIDCMESYEHPSYQINRQVLEGMLRIHSAIFRENREIPEILIEDEKQYFKEYALIRKYCVHKVSTPIFIYISKAIQTLLTEQTEHLYDDLYNMVLRIIYIFAYSC